MKFSATLIALAVFCLALVGCGAGDPMVGNWKLEMAPEALKGIPVGAAKPEVSVSFTDDGRFEMKASAMGQTNMVKGTYKLEGSSLSMTPSEVDGKPAPAGATTQSVTLTEDKKSFEMMGMGKMVKQ